MTPPSRTVLVARLDAEGDVLLAGPAVRAVAADARVVLLVGPRGVQAGAMLPGVDEVRVWVAPWIEPRHVAVTAESLALLEEIVRSEGVESAVILTSFHQSALPLALLLRLFGVSRITAVSEDYPGSLLDERVPDPGDVPEPERALAIARAAGFDLPEGDDGRLRVVEPLPDVSHLVPDDPYVVLHPGGTAHARRWLVDRWMATAERLSSLGVRTVVTGDGEDATMCGRICTTGGDLSTSVAGTTSFRELAAVLAGAQAVVVGNTGPAHLAAAVGTPIVSLFAPTVPAQRWAPHGVPVVLLGDQQAPCAGTRATSCPVEGHPCLATVRPDDVVDALASLGVPGLREVGV